MKVEEILKKHKIEYKIVKHDRQVIKSTDLENKNVKKEDVCKTIILKTRNGKYLAVCIKGEDRIDTKKVREIIEKKVDVASHESVEKSTGLKVGEICPLLINMPIIMDKKVFDKDKLHFGSGNLYHDLIINPKDLEKVIKFKICDVRKDE
ncbi:MAG: YbaK/EbsC family protein [Candidatus Nanoarchaeia archaeon]|jgi:Ala-tRNA(Pro) deacylase|nr:YbaK/EbsC family protein [Candidatus Nanoarchaeia archaeon]|tara:strand:- start:22437 stop:22886 length:450 start_codon:yes stop_codon:yes gene_type:complete